MNYAINPTTGEPWDHKYQRIAYAFLSGKPLNTVEHGPMLHTTCLHSDVPGLAKMGLKFDRTRKSVPGYGGAPTSVVEYRLRPESYQEAAVLLGLRGDTGSSAPDYLLASRGDAWRA